MLRVKGVPPVSGEQLLLSIVFQTRGGSFNQEEKRRHRLGQFGEMLWLPEPCYLGRMKLSVAGTHDALTSLGTRKPWSYSLLSLLSSSFLKPCNPLLLSQLCSTWAGTERNKHSTPSPRQPGSSLPVKDARFEVSVQHREPFNPKKHLKWPLRKLFIEDKTGTSDCYLGSLHTPASPCLSTLQSSLEIPRPGQA